MRLTGVVAFALACSIVVPGELAPGLSAQSPATVTATQPAAPAGTLPAPESFFGFAMGADGRLAAWPQIQRYFATIADASDRVDLFDIGPTTDGERLIAAAISSPENIDRLEQIRTDSLRLADPRTLPAAEAARLFETQPAIVAIGMSIHASEIGATQTANELLHKLATATDASTLSLLRQTVILLIPSLNPDGHKLVVDWFEKTRGTPFENAPMPWLYHRYAGHDINRDAFMLNLAENRAMADFFYRRWHPQIFLTMHQMGGRGPRFFVPPNYDPIDPNYDPLIWRTAGLLGHAMALALERDGRSGVVQNALFDYYWPGYEDSAPLGHNIVCLLTEVASVRLALPLEVAASELVGSPRGLQSYRAQINFPNPWPGGTWRLRDIVDYELSAAAGMLGAVERYRREIVENFYRMGQRAIDAGQAGDPYAFAITSEQFDPIAARRLIDLLVEGGVDVRRALEPFQIDGRAYPAGTFIVPMAQPFRAYAKTLLERQDYPVRKLSNDGPAERPYDVAGWTLPLQMGVRVDAIARSFTPPATQRVDEAAVVAAEVVGERRPDYYVVDARGSAGAIAAERLLAANAKPAFLLEATEGGDRRYPAGSVVVQATGAVRPVIDRIARELGLPAAGMRGKTPANVLPIRPSRVALYKPWVESIDEGWTRLLFERYEIPYTTVTDADVRGGKLRHRFDVLVVPDVPAERLKTGHRPGTLPPEYAGGLGDDGVAAIVDFADAGGTVVCLDSSCGLITEALRLPVRDLTREAGNDRFFCPGSIVSLDLDLTHPLAFGMPAKTAAFLAYGGAYDFVVNATPTGHTGEQPSPPVAIVGRYGQGNPLLSGWLEGPEVISGKGAILEARYGQGRAVLIGFRAQHRVQSDATFRLLFNAILTSGAQNRH